MIGERTDRGEREPLASFWTGLNKRNIIYIEQVDF